MKVEEFQGTKEIKASLIKIAKYRDNVIVTVKVYDAFEDEEQTYTVEVFVDSDGQETEYYDHQMFYGEREDDEDAKKQAVKRAKALKNLIKGWLEYNNAVVENDIEVYHV